MGGHTRASGILIGTAILAGGFEAISAVITHEMAPSTLMAAFGVLFLVCAWRLHVRQSLTATIVLAFLYVLELAGLPFYERTTALDWVVQMGFGAIAAIGFAAAVGVVLDARRRRAARAVPA